MTIVNLINLCVAIARGHRLLYSHLLITAMWLLQVAMQLGPLTVPWLYNIGHFRGSFVYQDCCVHTCTCMHVA